MPSTLTAITIIYNEEKLLDRCLSSVAGIADRIIVFHDGPCSDRSLEIAKKYTVDIVILDHKGYIEVHMAQALTAVQTDWVLVLDADEYLSDELRFDIKKLIADEEVDAYSFIEPIYIPEQNRYTDKVAPRRKNVLLRMSKLSYVGVTHAGYNTTGKVKIVDYILEHKPLRYNYSWQILITKGAKIAATDAKSYYIPWSAVPKYNYDGPDVRATRKQRFKLAHPLLSMPLVFINNFFRIMFVCRKINFFAVKFALYLSAYEVIVCYYIFKMKPHRDEKQ
jgi:glycosyltransferase involved in cell wall biosynthesis